MQPFALITDTVAERAAEEGARSTTPIAMPDPTARLGVGRPPATGEIDKIEPLADYVMRRIAAEETYR